MWSALKVTVATACNTEKINPNKAPINSDIHGVRLPKVLAKVRLNTVLPNAPIIIIPSSPTLTTPLLSEKVPPKAVKISGAAYTKVVEKTVINIVVKLIFQHRPSLPYSYG
ncbi:hypothetical protein IV36_GL001320 [Liquorilactobacillus mali]|uniref:Uncharacterized protein n=1 Tax=Liquorilactobacillus mali TaxID=1618 RepID=A0A0R2G115_9LACO|nr:hypothetical protein IV36_GL001320 [Liquorilactobacillus mali]